MNRVEKIIDGINVTYSTIISPSVGDYTVHNGKIWRVTGIFGASSGNCKTLERKNEKTSVPLSTKLPLVLKPTGYIPI